MTLAFLTGAAKAFHIEMLMDPTAIRLLGNRRTCPHLVFHLEWAERRQYLSIRYSERLGEAEIVASVGSKGDSYDLAESFNGLYKTELIHRKGPWRNVEQVEWATLNYVDWFNNRRIHEALDYVPPVEFEVAYYDSSETENLPVLETI
jgi:putative transposase